MSGIPRELAYAVAGGTKWKKAFLAIPDDSPIRLAGMAEWIGVTGYDKGSDRVYYMATEKGLHVGQHGGGGGLFGGGSHVDHFLPQKLVRPRRHPERPRFAVLSPQIRARRRPAAGVRTRRPAPPISAATSFGACAGARLTSRSSTIR